MKGDIIHHAVPTPSSETINKARHIFHEQREFPEDDWIRLSPAWDLNLFAGADGEPRATLYPVFDGNTETSVWFSVDILPGEQQ